MCWPAKAFPFNKSGQSIAFLFRTSQKTLIAQQHGWQARFCCWCVTHESIPLSGFASMQGNWRTMHRAPMWMMLSCTCLAGLFVSVATLAQPRAHTVACTRRCIPGHWQGHCLGVCCSGCTRGSGVTHARQAAGSSGWHAAWQGGVPVTCKTHMAMAMVYSFRCA